MKLINDFYAPLLVLRRTSKELHKIFKNGKDFRTLPKLIDGEKYKDNDRVLIEEIIKIGNECKNIIVTKSGLIDDDDLREIYIPRLLTHYILIEKAFNNEIQKEVERFDGYEFPNEIDDILDNKVRDLINKLEELNLSVERKTFKKI